MTPLDFLRLIGENRVGGIIVPFVSKHHDAYKTYWRSTTDFGIAPHQYRSRPIFFHHGLLGAKKGKAFRFRIGTLDDSSFEIRENGLYAEGDLELDDANMDAVLEARRLLRKSEAAWSSGVMPHQIEMDEDGFIRRWPVVEASVLDRQHAGDRSFTTKAYHVRKSGLIIPDEIPDDEELSRSPYLRGDELEMTPEEIAALAGQAASQAVTTALAPINQRLDQMAGTLTELQTAAPAPATRTGGEPLQAPVPDSAPVPTLRGGDYVASKYDEISLFGMLLHDRAKQIFNVQIEGRNHTRSEEFMRALLDKIEQQQAVDDAAHVWFRENPELRHFYQTPYRCVDLEARNAWKRIAPNLRANEVLGSTVVGFGDELVPTLLSSVAHWVFMMNTQILQLFPRFFMPSNTFNYPVVTSWPNFYRITELVNQSNMDIPNSPITNGKIGTRTVTFDAKAMGVMVNFSRELMEDSALPMMDITATALARSAAREMDYVALNGHELDTIANISYQSAAGSAPSVGGDTRILVMNGLRYMGLFTYAGVASATDSALSLGAVVGADLAYKLGLKMGSRGVMALDPKQSVLIADVGATHGINALAGYEQAYAVGEAKATLLTGVVNALKGVPVVATDQIPLTIATGEIPAALNGTKATAMRVYRENIKVGFRREISMEMGKVLGVDGFTANISTRFDIQEMEDKSVVIGFNITEPT